MIGSADLNPASGPEHIMPSLPLPAVATLPVIGESIIMIPCSRSDAASSWANSEPVVDRSTYVSMASPSYSPSLPSVTARNASSDGRQVKTIFACEAISLADGTERAPSATTDWTAGALRSWTRRLNPRLARCLAMGAPMAPSPIKPTGSDDTGFEPGLDSIRLLRSSTALGERKGSKQSIRSRAGLLDYLAPFGDFRLHESTELLRSRTNRFCINRGQALHDLIDLESTRKRCIELVDNFIRRPCRRENSDPVIDFVAGKSRFRNRRNVRQRCQALGSR